MLISALLLAAAPVTIASDRDGLDFSYRWSKEAEAVPALARRFRADAARQKRDMMATVATEKEMRKKMKLDFGGLQFSRAWTTSGQSRRLLSLVGASSAYTGGAHSNSGTKALLWERALGREIDWRALLQPGKSWDGAIRQPFCTLLDRERAKRRQEAVKKGEWPGQCPELKELTIALADHDRDGRFDHLDLTADPYVAGPYAEGAYEVSLPLTATMLARLKPAYRADFESQPPVQ
ncbi:hypothetical protein [Sphingomonas astaxanthinifaciens]|uniref:DUF4163 domain-containing protein n=1 Tax=Sphingomonas astaxanthinifaciens DSM 22298 TaxID=1123267 RepID=A0ABQ5Z4T7_9SPHN|nr:hypothetical protein [Sphingomonas astaxanthinifaciens]GLR47016.1 hypothetical protein GCM10007925_07270 [Sphingomonas astaxanthinifaciens DSM 22298]